MPRHPARPPRRSTARRSRPVRWWLAFASLLLAGCGDVTGKWSSVGLEPRMASDQFRLLRKEQPRGEFLRASFNLREDQTYTAEVYYVGDLGFSNGGWRQLGDRLRFVDNKYGTFSYRYQLSRDGRSLEIIQPIKGTDVRLTLRKQEPLLKLPRLRDGDSRNP
jgi:hypothetical protein